MSIFFSTMILVPIAELLANSVRRLRTQVLGSGESWTGFSVASNALRPALSRTAIGFPQLPTISGCTLSDIARIAADTDRDRMTGIKIGKISSIGLIDLGI